ncbi:type IV pilus modification protein PilV [Psychrobacter sp. DD43]|uniref:type IV pilus modification protein PilV n=1 Tax=Psychrobacter sp. DD43 TaxID=2774128 RepID=UPI001917F36C|nr:type IV pilus modification protein PilV [Psychrobacter sp. DD43]
MTSYYDQRGVGLIEVMVAILLLSIAVLGFSALQMRAINATDESLVRTKSLTLVRNLAEVMRAYPNAYVTGSAPSFITAPTATGAVSTVQAVMNSSATTTVTVDTKTIDMTTSANGCLSTGTKQETVDSIVKTVPAQNCNMSQLAARDTLMVKKIAKDEDISMTVVTCPGTTTQAIQTQMCVIAAWNDTKAILSDSDANACATSNGVYKTDSHCLISEAY